MHACLGKVIGRWAEHSRPNNLSTEAWDLLGLWYRRVALAGDAAMGLDRDQLAAHRAELEATHSRKGVEFKLTPAEVTALLTYTSTHRTWTWSCGFRALRRRCHG